MEEKIVVDKEKCLQCGMCTSLASDTFTFDDNGDIKVINEEITEEVKTAADSCPAGAISIEKNK